LFVAQDSTTVTAQTSIEDPVEVALRVTVPVPTAVAKIVTVSEV